MRARSGKTCVLSMIVRSDRKPDVSGLACRHRGLAGIGRIDGSGMGKGFWCVAKLLQDVFRLGAVMLAYTVQQTDLAWSVGRPGALGAAERAAASCRSCATASAGAGRAGSGGGSSRPTRRRG